MSDVAGAKVFSYPGTAEGEVGERRAWEFDRPRENNSLRENNIKIPKGVSNGSYTRAGHGPKRHDGKSM